MSEEKEVVAGGRHLIFVYGTLMEGEGNWSWALAPASPFFLAQTQPAFELRHLGGFPGMIRGDRVVQGEVFEIDDEQLRQIDRLEGHPTFYRREEIMVQPLNEAGFATGDAVPVSTYIYQGHRSSGSLIPNGRWRNRARGAA
jgi:gamma-glutamylaminecyclotransferase